MGDVAVTGVGVVSPWGDEAGAAAVYGGLPADGAWFDHRARLGARGYKYLPAAAQYVLAAARAAVADGDWGAGVPADRRGLLLATNAGLAGAYDAMDATVAERGADGISPALAPYFAVNVLGNRLAAELSLHGFALTVATARTAALDALSTGVSALAAGRCGALLLAAAEEPVPAARGGGGEQGAAVLALEPLTAARARGTAVHATLRARSVFLPPGALERPEGRERAARVLERVLEELVPGARRHGSADPAADADRGASGPPAVRVHLDLDTSPVCEAVAGVLAGTRTRAAAGPDEPASRRTGCLGPALALAHAVTDRDGGERLVVSATGAGQVAFVRVSPVQDRHTQELQHAEVA
ncbi:beta-ketoacyl synthase N-terminal-like domain-containing protein [Streptomyces sp. NPDC091972]|uniref:beta-ketoacyl synthase N-terminal-like domain-containing protein n=1 Tax=Streptomyces sp. NPDC091972 TaxID=3366007 RepID=UPI003807BD9C